MLRRRPRRIALGPCRRRTLALGVCGGALRCERLPVMQRRLYASLPVLCEPGTLALGVRWDALLCERLPVMPRRLNASLPVLCKRRLSLWSHGSENCWKDTCQLPLNFFFFFAPPWGQLVIHPRFQGLSHLKHLTHLTSRNHYIHNNFEGPCGLGSRPGGLRQGSHELRGQGALSGGPLTPLLLLVLRPLIGGGR
jgi:hypothetical protein